MHNVAVRFRMAAIAALCATAPAFADDAVDLLRHRASTLLLRRNVDVELPLGNVNSDVHSV